MPQTDTVFLPPPKVALITGATGGIGRATSLALATEGYALALHHHRTDGADAREALLEQITEAQRRRWGAFAVTPQASFFQADMADLEAVSALYTSVVKRFGRAPSVVVLNAGTTGATGVVGSSSSQGKGGGGKGGGIAAVSAADFEHTWRVNTLAPFRLAQLAVPEMQAAGWGRVVFTSSVAGMTGGVVGPHYASSKSALHGLVHWLAADVAKHGVTVNAVAPALIEDTAMLPGAGDELKKKIPVGRLGRPEEVAATIVWMVNNAYVTNKVIAVDGGMAIQ